MPAPSAWPTVYAILDADACRLRDLAPRDVLEAWLGAGISLLQVRGKSLSTRELVNLSALAVSVSRGRARIIINDRADIAKVVGADGVHVGQDDLPPEAARALLGPDAIIGLSTHSLAQAQAALTSPVSYLAVGPVFQTGSKVSDYEALGTGVVADVCALARPLALPVVAIGGITVETAASVRACGVTAVCAIGALMGDGHPGMAAAGLLDASR